MKRSFARYEFKNKLRILCSFLWKVLLSSNTVCQRSLDPIHIETYTSWNTLESETSARNIVTGFGVNINIKSTFIIILY